MSPLYHIVHGFCQAVHPDRGPLDGPVPSVCRPYPRTVKSKANALAVLGLASSLFDFARSPTDAKPQTHCLTGVAHRGVRRATRSAVSTTAGHPRVGLACLARCPSSRLSSPLVSAVSLALIKSSSLTWSRFTSGIYPVACSSSDSTKALLAPSAPYCVIASNTSVT